MSVYFRMSLSFSAHTHKHLIYWDCIESIDQFGEIWYLFTVIHFGLQLLSVFFFSSVDFIFVLLGLVLGS